ncbi:hypothetical protein [Demequina oxidasica]|nr:hypothetical protein [Demequina oxidasica]
MRENDAASIPAAVQAEFALFLGFLVDVCKIIYPTNAFELSDALPR